MVGAGEGGRLLEKTAAGEGEGLGLSRIVVGDGVLGDVVMGEGMLDDCEGSGEIVEGLKDIVTFG